MLSRSVSVLTVSSFIFTSAAVTSVPARAYNTRRVALVIGNSKYVDDVTALSNPANDAADVADALQGMGFEVTRALDVDIEGFRKSLRTFAQTVRGADMAVFYYAGHAMHFDEESYLMPIGTKLEDESAVRFDMISLEEDVIGKTMRDVPLKILLLDACRDNPIASHYEADEKTRSLGKVRGLSPLRTDVPKGELIAYATQPNQVAADGDGRNSPFSSALKRHIAEPGVEIRTMLDEVTKDVISETHEHQVPQISVSLDQRVFLNPGETDRDVWNRIEKSDASADFNDFLNRFPKSDFASAAKANLRTLELEATVKRLEAEQAMKAEAAAQEAAAAQDAARKQAAAAELAIRQRQEAEAEAARQKAARQELEAQAADAAAKQKEAVRQQQEQAEAARQQAARLDLESKNAARIEAAREQAALAKSEGEATLRREEARQQALLETAARERAAKEEAARQEVARLEAARIEAAQKQAAKIAMEARQEAARQAEQSAAADAARQKAAAAEQEAQRQAALRAEMAQQEAERQASAKAQREWQDALREDARHYQAQEAEAARQVAAQQEAARRLAAQQAADHIAAAKAEAARQQAAQQQAAKAEVDRENALTQTDQAKLDVVKQKEAQAAKAREDAARNEQQQAKAKMLAERRALDKVDAARKAFAKADEAIRRHQMVALKRTTASVYAVARPARAEASRVSAPSPASEAPGCMTCGF